MPTDLVGRVAPGYDAVDDSDPGSYNHSQSIAGICAANTNNGEGIAGCGYNVQVMGIRAFSNDVTLWSELYTNLERAFNYCISNKEAGMTAARFPGGGIANQYKWKLGIGPLWKRPRVRFGIDEFIVVCKEIGCEPIITVNYFDGSEEAADLVEYLNSPNDGSNPRGGTDRASVRDINGHSAPYGVRFFEIGNEVSHGLHDGPSAKNATPVSPDRYANDF